MPLKQMSSALPADLIEVGRVVSAYGVRGWVKVQPYSADAEALLSVKKWWLRAPVPPNKAGDLATAPAQLFTVVKSRPHSATVVAQFQGFDDRDLAEKLKAHTVWISRAEFPSVDEDEYYWVDLIGCLLYGDHNGQSVLVGQVANVFDNGAHAVLEVHIGFLNDQAQFISQLDAKQRPVVELVPFVEAYINEVDQSKKTIRSSWPFVSN